MATSTYGTPYVQGSDLVSAYPTASSNLATRVDEVSYKRNGLNAQTGTTYTLVVGDAGKTITLSNASPVAVTLPQDSTADLPDGAVVNFYNLGAGVVTISQGTGATLEGGSITLPQYGSSAVIKLSANTYGPFSGSGIPASAENVVTTSQSTTSTSYTDLATVGPTVTLTTGTKALVLFASRMTNTSSGPQVSVSVAVSGATTVAASDDWRLCYDVADGTYNLTLSRAELFTGLTAGSNTFTVKYKTSSSTGTFSERSMTVLNMGS